jgi:hypothetical protein
MTLREQQSEFVRMAARLLMMATTLGYELTFGDAYRDPRVPYGHPRSLHKQRLALDLNLFQDGVLQEGTEAHRPLGEWWESIGGTWGGRWNDGNHYSVAWQGMQ